MGKHMDRWRAVATAVMVLIECRDGSAYGQVAGCSYSSNGTAGLIQCRDGSAYGQVAGCSYSSNGTDRVQGWVSIWTGGGL